MVLSGWQGTWLHNAVVCCWPRLRLLSPMADAVHIDPAHHPVPDAGGLPAITAVVAQASRRLFVQTAVVRLLWVAPPMLLVFGTWILLVRLAIWPQAWDTSAELGLAVLAALAGGSVLAQRRVAMAVARQLDGAAGTADQLSTALWLAQAGQQDGWAHLQTARAAAAASTISLPQALPWPVLRPWPLVGALALLVTVILLPPPRVWLQDAGTVSVPGLSLRWPGGPEPFASAADLLGEEGLALLEVDAEVLAEVTEQVTDPATKQWLTALREVVQAVQEGRLDKQQALQKLAELEATRPGQSADAGTATPDPTGTAPSDPAEAERQKDVAVKNALAEAAKEAVKAAPKGPEAEAIKKAAESGDLGKLADAVEKLAGKDMSDAELEKWVKALEKFADKLGDRKVPEKFKALAERIARLQDKRNKEGGLSQSDQRRLQDAKHELQQLRKEQGDVEGAKHQVQRLEKQVRHAADEMRRAQQEQQQRLGKDGKNGKDGKDGQQGQDGQSGEAGQNGKQAGAKQQMREAMRQAADELRRESEGQKSRQAQRMGQSRLRDLREGLSRAKQQRRQAQGGKQDRGKQGEEGGDEGQEDGDKGEEGDGQQGDAGQQDGDQPGDGAGKQPGRQAGKQAGQQGQGNKAGQRKGFRLGSGSLGDKSRTQLIREGYGQKTASTGNGEGGEGEPGRGKGGPNNGKRSGAEAGRDERVKGAQGSGPDTKQVFLDTAKKGFARQGWRDVYGEYSEVAEEMIDKQQLPAGKKRLVRRYFEKIRPR